jgi:hypothetical protein
MEFQLAETVEELEAQRSTLTQKINKLVDTEGDADEVASLLREKTALGNRIAEAKAERVEQERERKRLEREQAERDMPGALAECRAERTAFLEHRRKACIALGNYLKALARAYEVSNQLSHETLGPLPQYQNSVLALELQNAPQESIADLAPDMGAGWKLTFTVAPMYETQNSRR